MYSQAIALVRLDPQHAQSDRKSVNRALKVFDLPRGSKPGVAILGADQKECGLWERE